MEGRREVRSEGREGIGELAFSSFLGTEASKNSEDWVENEVERSTNLKESICSKIERLLSTTVDRHFSIGLSTVALVSDDDDGWTILSLHSFRIQNSVKDVWYPTEGCRDEKKERSQQERKSEGPSGF